MSALICSLRRYTAASTARFRFSSYRLLPGSHAPPPPPPFSSRCHHQITAGPLLMCPGNIVEDKVTGVKTIYDQFYDPQTGILKSKERRLQSVPNTAEICASSRGWLGLVDTTRDCSLYLANSLLFSGEGGDGVRSEQQPSVFKLPSIETLRGITKKDHHNKDYVVTSKCGKGIMKQREYPGEDLMREFMKGIVLSADPNEEHCTVMLVFGETIAFCKPGLDDEWTENYSGGDDDEPFDYSDWMWKPSHPVYLESHKRFYNLFEMPRSLEGKHIDQNPWLNDNFESWDVTRAPQLPDHEAKEPYSATPYVIRHRKHKCHLKAEHIRKWTQCRLADDQSGDLLLAEPCGEYHNNIYRLEIDERQLWRAKSAGDVAVFIGPYECFSLSIKDFPQLRPNSVYYIHNEYQCSGIYNMGDKSVTPLEWPFKNSYNNEKPVFWISPPRASV